MASLGERIRDARKAANITQELLAKRAGLSQGKISRFEVGGTDDPGVHDVARIARALGVPIEALLDEEMISVTPPAVDPRPSIEDRVDKLERQLLLTAQTARDAFALAQSLANPLSANPSRESGQ